MRLLFAIVQHLFSEYKCFKVIGSGLYESNGSGYSTIEKRGKGQLEESLVVCTVLGWVGYLFISYVDEGISHLNIFNVSLSVALTFDNQKNATLYWFKCTVYNLLCCICILLFNYFGVSTFFQRNWYLDIFFKQVILKCFTFTQKNIQQNCFQNW